MNPLEVRALRAEFRIDGVWREAVAGVSFTLAARETLALVGESGCGKSVTAMSVMGLIRPPVGRVASGEVVLEGRNIAGLAEPALEKLRGARMAMIFQEPMTALNPVMTVGDQVAESLIIHRGLSHSAAMERARALFEEVKIPSAATRLRDYPHQFSGGMRQRVMIAMALMNDPELLIADEPTTALDVTIQAQILRLLAQLQADLGLALLLITHDLGVVARVAHQVSVMYAGEVVENAATADLFAAPRHPYTRGLLDCLPIPGKVAPGAPLGSIPGMVPKLTPEFTGCGFRSRCSLARAECAAPVPMRGSPHHYRCVVDA